MKSEEHKNDLEVRTHCCPCCQPSGVTRRGFLGGMGAAAAGGAALAGLSWTAMAQAAADAQSETLPRRALKAKPVLVYSTPKRQAQSSWRNWGGIETEQDADAEVARIGRELGELRDCADFPLEFLPVAKVRTAADLSAVGDLAGADVILVYAAGGWMEAFDSLAKTQKDMIFFCRHKSGPVYLWYEIISPRYLRQHTDRRAVTVADEQDVVIDSQDEMLWRLRALCGLHNTLGSRIVALGGAGGWAQPKAPQFAKDKWKLDIQDVSYEKLAELLKAAKAESGMLERMNRQADEYMKLPGTTLETKREFLVNGFLLTEVFRGMMHSAGCRAMTIQGCMGTVMPISETTACISLSLLNDSGYMAFCESDFVVVPAGMLLANISGLPVFLNDPTYPHDHVITLAHCTAPRKMDGKTIEPARIMTHFESDYGAAPKVEMRPARLSRTSFPILTRSATSA